MAELGETVCTNDLRIGEASIEDVVIHWNKIDKACKDFGFYDFEPEICDSKSLKSFLLNRTMVLHMIVLDNNVCGVAICQIEQKSQYKIGHVTFVGGGQLLRWGGELITYLRKWFTGCKYVTYLSQPGWQRWASSKKLGEVWMETLEE